MKHIARNIHERASTLARHPLFSEWIENDAVPLEERFLFSPMAIDFVMGFRDLNRYFIAFPEPANALEAALNAHAEEDASHSQLFLQDWVALGLDERLGWAPRDLYWWQSCEETLGARRADFQLTRMIWESPDPLLRFAIIESIEAAGHVFFQRTAPVAKQLSARTGRAFPYYGEQHLHLESGHLQNADERAFFRARLTEAQQVVARGLVERVFEIFDLHFHAWLRYAMAMQTGEGSYRPAEAARAGTALRPDRPLDLSRCFSFQHPTAPQGPWAELAREQKLAFDALWETPFCSWLRDQPAGSFEPAARSILLHWIVDSWACADWFTLDTPYEAPTGPLERGINRLSCLYAAEMRRRYVEWESLGIDEITGWSLSEALRHYWLDPGVEQMRAVFARLRALTFRFPEPLHRYWIMKCFVRFGDAMMHSLGVVMRRSGVPDEAFPAMSGCADRLHPDLPPDPEADDAIAALETEPLSTEDLAVLREILLLTSAQEASRLSSSWDVVCGQRPLEIEAA